MPARHTKVLIIGSGHAGGMAAKVLTENGIPCLMLNAGPAVDVTRQATKKLPDELPFRGFKPPGKLEHVFQASEFNANVWVDERGARERDMQPGQYVAICVTDTGTGMPPDVMARAFDPFYTTKPTGEGTGLGLSMVYGFAKQSNGQVRLYSELGAGTTVRIYLPRRQGDEVNEEETPPTLAGAARAEVGETVLVVDDEPSVRMLVTEVLEELGYAAIEAADSASGLKVLQSDVRIDLLITDVGLPGGMNGRQMTDAARQKRPKLKVLFITGYAENAAISNGHLEPGMHLLTKPFAMEKLASRIKAIITAS